MWHVGLPILSSTPEELKPSCVDFSSATGGQGGGERLSVIESISYRESLLFSKHLFRGEKKRSVPKLLPIYCLNVVWLAIVLPQSLTPW